MEITLSPEAESLIRQRVDSGQYASPEEVLQHALRLLEQHDRLRSLQRDDLKTAIARGIEKIESGEATSLDDAGLPAFLKSIQAEGRRRRAALGDRSCVDTSSRTRRGTT